MGRLAKLCVVVFDLVGGLACMHYRSMGRTWVLFWMVWSRGDALECCWFKQALEWVVELGKFGHVLLSQAGFIVCCRARQSWLCVVVGNALLGFMEH